MFEPWIGSRYGKADSVLETRLLILGESHYSKDPKIIGTSPSDFTISVVEHFAIKRRHPFFGLLQQIVTGMPKERLTRDQKDTFWHSVAFANYVPVVVDGRPFGLGGAARRPTPAEFEKGAAHISTILSECKPDAVIVCGLALWEFLGPNLAGFGNPDRETIYFDDGNAIFARIHHPSWPKFNAPKWQTRAHYLLSLAAEERRPGRRITWNQWLEMNA